MSEPIPWWASKGARVVCVSVTWFTDPEPGFSHPVIGGVYTIRDREWNAPRQKWGLSFMEGHPDDLYAVNNFRPAVEDDTETRLYKEKGLQSKAPREVDA